MVGSSSQDSLSVRNKLPATSTMSKKKLMAKKMKRFYLIQKIIPRKSYGLHFEIVIVDFFI